MILPPCLLMCVCLDGRHVPEEKAGRHTWKRQQHVDRHKEGKMTARWEVVSPWQCKYILSSGSMCLSVCTHTPFQLVLISDVLDICLHPSPWSLSRENLYLHYYPHAFSGNKSSLSLSACCLYLNFCNLICNHILWEIDICLHLHGVLKTVIRYITSTHIRKKFFGKLSWSVWTN